MDIIAGVKEFIQKANRLANVAYLPREKEYLKMAKITALGMITLGVFGVVVSFVLGFL